MRWFRLIVLYTALGLGANAAVADTAALEALREGSMTKLNFHSTPKPVAADVAIERMDASPASLADHKGEVVLLNFWATWCAPCRKEMPALDALQKDLGGDGFNVVTVATGRNSVPAITRFFQENNVENVIAYRDPKQALAKQMAVLGLPITILIDRDGNEIARLQGEADWNSESARAIITAFLAGDAG